MLWFFIFLFFSHKIHSTHILPSVYFSQFPSCPFPQIHSSISLQERTVFQVISTELSITRCSKTRLTPSYQGWTRHRRRKRVPRTGKSQRYLHLHCQESHRNPKLRNHTACVEGLVQTYAGSMVAASVYVSPSEPCLVDSLFTWYFGLLWFLQFFLLHLEFLSVWLWVSRVSVSVPVSSGRSLSDADLVRHWSMNTENFLCQLCLVPP